jgi:hypothetical protein
MRRKAIALLLAVAMMVTFMPAMAFAEDPPQQQPTAQEELEKQIEELTKTVEELTKLIGIFSQFGDQFDALRKNAETVVNILDMLNTNVSDFLKDYDTPEELQKVFEDLRSNLNDEFRNQLEAFADSLKNSDELKQIVKDFVTQYENMQAAVDRAIGIVNGAIGYGEDWVNRVKGDFDQLEKVFGDIVNKLDQNWEAMLDDIAQRQQAAFKDLQTRVNNWLVTTGQNLKNFTQDRLDEAARMAQLFKDMVEYQQELTKRMLINVNTEIQNELKAVHDALMDQYAATADAVQKMVARVNRWLKATNDHLYEMTQYQIAAFLDAAKGFQDAVAKQNEYLKQLTKDFIADHPELVNQFKALVAQTEFVEAKIADLVGTMIEIQKAELQNLLNNVNAWVKGVNDNLKTLTQAQAQKLLDLVQEFNDKLVAQNEFIKQQLEGFDYEDLVALCEAVADKFADMNQQVLDALVAQAAEVQKNVENWIKVNGPVIKQMTKDSIQKAYALAQKFEELVAAQEVYAKEMLDKADAAIRKQFEELQKQTEAVAEQIGKMVSYQLEALKAQSAAARDKMVELVTKVNFRIARNAAEAIEQMKELAANAAMVMAQYQLVLQDMSKAAKEKMQSDLQKLMDVYNQAVEQYKVAVKQFSKIIEAAKAGDVEQLLALFDLVAQDFGIDYEKLIEDCVDQIMALVESEEFQNLLEELIALGKRVEATATDIYKYGSALAAGEVQPLTDLENKVIELTETVGSRDEEIAKLYEAISNLEKSVESLTNANDALTKENADLKANAQIESTEYKTLVANTKNARKVTRNKVTLKKKSTKSTKAKKITIKWKKWDSANGEITKYQVYYKKDGAKKGVKKFVKKSKTKYVAKKLKSGKVYKVKVRAVYKLPYKNAAGETKTLTFYSRWSKSKKVKVK